MERKSDADSEGMNRECEGFGVRITVNSDCFSKGFGDEEPAVIQSEVDKVCWTDGSTVR